MTVRTISRWVAWLLVAAAILFTVAPIGYRPNTPAPASVERFAAIALITAAFCLGYPRYRIPILVAVIIAVGALEVAQDMIPGRHGRKIDLAVKVAGALIGGAAAALIDRGRKTA